jgi:hypothetical protein
VSHYANLKKVDFYVLQTAGKKKDLSSMLYTVHSTCTVDHSANSTEKKNVIFHKVHTTISQPKAHASVKPSETTFEEFKPALEF